MCDMRSGSRATSAEFVEEKNTGVIPIAFLDPQMGKCSENGISLTRSAQCKSQSWCSNGKLS